MDKQISPNIDTETSTSKPQWLQDLEAQSWQAELIASGLAIYGSFAIGDYLSGFAESLIPLFSEGILSKLKYVFIYLFMVQSFLVVSFIVHLILRILWAGFLGLNSVFPDGVKVSENSGYTLSFLQKIQEEFGDLSAYSLKLDNYCSVIFSILCCMVLAILHIALWVAIFILIAESINYFIQPGIGDVVMYVLVGLFFLFSIFVYLITTGPLKTREFSEKHSYKISHYATRTMYFLAYKPLSYVMWVSRTNLSGKQFFFLFTVLIFPVSFVAGMWYANSLSLFGARNYYYLNHLPSRTNELNYIDQVKDVRLLRPAIQSREIRDNYIKLFIPKYKRDEASKIEICGIWEVPKTDTLERVDRLKLEEEFDVDCAKKYFQIAIDGAVYPDLEFSYIRHPNRGERGYLTYIPLDSITTGQHLLEIKTAYVYEGKKEGIRKIPFYLDK